MTFVAEDAAYGYGGRRLSRDAIGCERQLAKSQSQSVAEER
ncbi:hypothetical protein GZL_02328 [Streptomyces sp. 769]|nr:hypothetical protein GZL_02328 [Streptomyces sp. 769]